MALLDVRKILWTGLFGLAVVFALQVDVNAQSRRDIERERQRIERENARYQRDRQRRSRNNRNDAVTRRTERQIENSSYASGYQQGLMMGQYDRRSEKYNRSNVYRDTGAYPNEGDPTSIDYLYRQGYLQGYNDGFHGIRNY